MKNVLTIFLLFITTSAAFTQGTIRGMLIDTETQEPLIGGVVKVDGSSAGAVTDIDGAYSIQVPAGIYTVVHSYIGYQDIKVTEVEVINGQVNSLGQVNISTGGEGSDLEAVVVTAYVQQNTEEGLLNFQRNSTKILDAVSAQSIARTGDSDVAAVVKRVPGVTIEGGKYVYVRGLGDRYSKSIVNGMEIPGLDPERNTVQMDIFPSSIIDNIVVYKTFSPDLPGDFTGGMVDVITKDFPLEKEFKISASLGYNTETTFNNNFLLYESETADAFGFGSSNREIPFALDYRFGTEGGVSQQDFDNTLALNNRAQPKTFDNFLNGNFSLSYGNQYDISENNKLGFVGAINYKNDYSFRPEFIRNDLLVRAGSNGEIDNENAVIRNGNAGYNEGVINGMVGLSLKNENNSYSLKAMHTRAGEKSALSRDADFFDADPIPIFVFTETTLNYFEREITNLVLNGENFFDDKELSWGISGTQTAVSNPDLVQTLMARNDDGTTSFSTNANYSREWRELEDQNLNARVDFKQPFTLSGKDSFLKAGVFGNYKTRDFIIYNLFVDRTAPLDFQGDLDNILSQNFLVPVTNSLSGTQGYVVDAFDPSAQNQFIADSWLTAGYVMGDLQLTDQLKFIGGLRAENFVMNYEGEVPNNDTGTLEPFNGETLNDLEFLPSANLVYEVKEFMNLRGSYNRTLARPSFKEKSGTKIFDPIQGQFFNGNILLEQTLIDNYDLRWEYFFGERELVSLSPFYKKFSKPIEIIALAADDIIPRNQNDADVYGFEFELRKDFSFLNESLENLFFNGNFTFVESIIALTDPELSKYNNTTVDAPDDRTLLGQSPYSINAALDYSTNEGGWSANLGYNVKGKTLSIVGIDLTPNVYEDPFHNLDFKLGKEFGKSKISLTARNILDDNIDYFYEFDGEEKGVFSSFDVGQTFSLGYSIDLD